jgi:hypothetical protein
MALVRQKEAICDYFTLKGFPSHLKPLQHGASAVHIDLPLEESFGNRDVANEIAGTLRTINAQGDVNTASFAATYHIEEMLKVERLRSVKNTLAVSIRRVAVN